MNIVVISFNLDISLSSFCVFDPLHFSHLFYVFEKQTLIGISWTGPSHSSVVLNCIKNHFQLNALFFFCFFFWNGRKLKNTWKEKSFIMSGRKAPEICITGTYFHHWRLIQSQAAKFGSHNQTFITTRTTRSPPCLMACLSPTTCIQLTHFMATEVRLTRKWLSMSGRQAGEMLWDFHGGREMCWCWIILLFNMADWALKETGSFSPTWPVNKLV